MSLRRRRHAFVSDAHGEWPFPSGSRRDLGTYAEVTDRVVQQLIEAQILADHGKGYVDPDDPDQVYERDLRNVWSPGGSW